VPRVEVRCPLPCPEVTGVTIQVSSPRYWCPLVRNRHKIWAFRCFPTTSGPWPRLWLKVSWNGEPPSMATWQISKLAVGWPRRMTRKPRAAGDSRPVEAIARDGSRQNESRSALNSRAPFGYPCWGFPWFSSVARQMPVPSYAVKRRNVWQGGRRPALHTSLWPPVNTLAWFGSARGVFHLTKLSATSDLQRAR